MAEKKYKKVVRNPKTGRKKTVRYGAKGYSIAKRGDQIRSAGQMKKFPSAKNCARKKRRTNEESSQNRAKNPDSPTASITQEVEV